MRFSATVCLLALVMAAVLATAAAAQAIDGSVRVVNPGVRNTAIGIRKPPAQLPTTDTMVSILEEARPHADENDTNDSMAALADTYWAAGLQRVLAVRGLGPLANARELLHLRGIDMAVLNADVTAYSKVTGELPGLAGRLNSVLKLYDKTIIILALGDVKSLQDLANQKILALGADSDSHVSTRALFGLLNIPVTIGDANFTDALQQVIDGKAKALVTLVEHDDETLGRLPAGKGLHVVPVPMTDALATVYLPVTVPLVDAPALAVNAEVLTVKVASIIATYGWKPTHARYYPVAQFVRSLPQAIATLRKQGNRHVWREIDGREEVPGWTRFDPATTVVAKILPDTSALASEPATEKKVKAAPQSPSVTATGTIAAGVSASTESVTVAKLDSNPKSAPKPREALPGGIEIAARTLSGLADPSAQGGGLLTELVTTGLGGTPTHLTWPQAPESDLQDEQHWTGTHIGLGWAHPTCDGKTSLSASEQSLCDRFLFSKPIFQALQVFLVRHGSDFVFERDEQVIGHTVCAAAGTDTAALDTPSRGWLKQDLITLLHKPDLDQCLKALDHGDVEVVFADDLPSRAALEKLGLVDKIEAVGRPVATLHLSAIAEKSNPLAADLIARIDDGIAALKADGRYTELVLSRMRNQSVSGGEQAVK